MSPEQKISLFECQVSGARVFGSEDGRFCIHGLSLKVYFMCAINSLIFTDLEHHIHLHAHDQSFFLSFNCKKDDHDNYLIILTHGESLVRFRR